MKQYAKKRKESAIRLSERLEKRIDTEIKKKWDGGSYMYVILDKVRVEPEINLAVVNKEIARRYTVAGWRVISNEFHRRVIGVGPNSYVDSLSNWRAYHINLSPNISSTFSAKLNITK